MVADVQLHPCQSLGARKAAPLPVAERMKDRDNSGELQDLLLILMPELLANTQQRGLEIVNQLYAVKITAIQGFCGFHREGVYHVPELGRQVEKGECFMIVRVGCDRRYRVVNDAHWRTAARVRHLGVLCSGPGMTLTPEFSLNEKEPTVLCQLLLQHKNRAKLARKISCNP